MVGDEGEQEEVYGRRGKRWREYLCDGRRWMKCCRSLGSRVLMIASSRNGRKGGWWWLVEASWWRLKGFLGFRLQLCPPLPPWSHVTRVCVFQIHVRLRHTPPMTTLPYSGLSLLFDPLHSGAVHVDQTSLMPRCRMASAIPRINENSKS